MSSTSRQPEAGGGRPLDVRGCFDGFLLVGSGWQSPTLSPYLLKLILRLDFVDVREVLS